MLLTQRCTHQAHGKDGHTRGPGKGKEEPLPCGGCYQKGGPPSPCLSPEPSPKAAGTDFRELISHLRFSAIETAGLRG